MSPRERVMAVMVGVVAFLFVNFFVVDYFLKNQRRLRTDLARNQAALDATRRTIAEKPKWDQRDAWLQANQPALATSDDVAGGQLLDLVKAEAKKNSVQIGNQALRPPGRQPSYSAVSVEVDATATWPSIIGFMRELQGPKKFVVFESANLKVDDKDATQMRGTFKIAKWFGPKLKLR